MISTRRSRASVHGWVVLAASLTAGCGGAIEDQDAAALAASAEAQLATPQHAPAQIARTRFARAFYCPESRVTVTPVDRPNVPPTEIAGDGDRLAMWRTRNGPEPRAFDVSGCGRRIRLVCSPAAAEGDVGSTCVMDRSQADVAATTPSTAAPDSATSAAPPSALPARGPHGAGSGFDADVGVVVRRVVPGGPADGRLRVGDVILSAGGKEIHDERMLQSIVRAHAGTMLDLSVRRGDQVVGTAIAPGSE